MSTPDFYKTKITPPTFDGEATLKAMRNIMRALRRANRGKAWRRAMARQHPKRYRHGGSWRACVKHAQKGIGPAGDRYWVINLAEVVAVRDRRFKPLLHKGRKA